jgi:oligopeptide/dipeptide ABC transporter ATP-binding protein
MTALLEARHVTKIFGGSRFTRAPGTVALDDFSFRVDEEPPTITAIVGESGSGKTTLARLLLGLASPTSGEVLYRGQNLQRLSAEERKRFLRDVQVIFQDPYEVYNPFYKVDHVLETPIKKFRLAPSRAKARQLMEETLNAVGLRPEETLGRHPHQLSGGQRQRIMVARALLLQPRLIIADAHQISQNILVMYRGEVAEAGDVDLVVKDPRHPYTQLLIQSIPKADPEHPWHGHELPIDPSAPVAAVTHGCKFADRCPYAMEISRQQRPPLFRTDERRAAACFLYKESPKLEGTDLEQVMAMPVPVEA